MPTSIDKYLDPIGLDETVLNIRQIAESLETDMQDLPYARPDGIYPDMTVGAVIGADETAQWAQRESTGSGAATVRSVQGAAEVQDGELVPVRIAGIASTDAQGGELDAIEWTAQTLRAAGSVRDALYSAALETHVGVVDLGTLTWTKNNETEYVQDWRTSGIASLVKSVSSNITPNITCVLFTPMSRTAMTTVSNTIGVTSSGNIGINTPPNTYATAAEFKAAMNGVLLFYELAEYTVYLISPALPMTYRVQAGGSESIIVPEGEVSAAPVLTIAEPVNMSTELALIWAAIEQLQSRGTAQLSRPVSLTDVVNVDETQKDTTDVVEIGTIKEVQE